MPNNLEKRMVAVLKMPKAIGNAIIYARAIVARMTGNTNFVSPSPTLATITTEIDALETAQKAVKPGDGSVQNRNDKYSTLLGDLRSLTLYVQGIADVANKTGDLNRAASIIESSGMFVKGRSPVLLNDMEAKSKIEGIVELRAHTAEKHQGWEWQQSADGTVWTSLAGTTAGKTTVIGLVSGAKLWFRSRPILPKRQATAWLGPVKVTVM